MARNHAKVPLVGDLREKDEELGQADYFEVKPRGGLAERMAVRAGFSAPKLNTDGIRSCNLGSSFVTIPPGLSPTSFLESPVFISNSMVQPSPTTGKFEFDHSRNWNEGLAPCSRAESFVFKPLGESRKNANANDTTSLTLYPRQSGMSQSASPSPESQDTGADVSSAGDFSDEITEDGDGENRGESSIVVSGIQSDDCYNWRKYGQKHVKGSEYPRSYYKCTHPNCEVKKKVEHTLEGVPTEITYQGNHNHPMPNSQVRHLGVGPDMISFGDSVLLPSDRAESLSFPPVLDENNQGSEGFLYEDGGGSDLPSNVTNEEDGQGGVMEEEELESKRRRMDMAPMDMSGASRAVREPRVVVQTTSEVDILDDGYRWRKYGQKVVKGNPNPRSYYKCTNPGCTVRKHVERASNDLKSVITTYEGKHNHEVPAVRSSSQPNNSISGGGNGAVAASAQLANRRPLQGLPSFDGPLHALPPAPLQPLVSFARARFPTFGQTAMWALRHGNGWPGSYPQIEDPAAAGTASAAGQFGSSAGTLDGSWLRDTPG